MVGADALFGLGQVAWNRYQISQAEQRMAQMFKSAFPDTPVIDAPMAAAVIMLSATGKSMMRSGPNLSSRPDLL